MEPNSQPLDDGAWASFDRYLAGEAVPPGGLPDGFRHEALGDVLRDPATFFADGGREGPDSEMTDPVRWEALAAHARHSIAQQRPSQTRAGRWPWRRYVMYGAGLVAVIGIAVWRGGYLPLTPTPSTQREYATARAERATVRLPDGSEVTLAPDSRLQFTQDDDGTRLDLVGQAYFVVTHDPARAFAVYTGNSATRVLGTAFSVRRYSDDERTEVRVEDGKVAVENSRTSKVVTPGNVIQLSDSSVAMAVDPHMRDETAWRNGQLVFRSVPLSSVLASLGLWSGYDFRVVDSTMNNRAMTAVFNMNNIAETLTSLKTVLNVTLTVEGNVITLHPQSGRSPAGVRDSSRQRIKRIHQDIPSTREVGR